MRLILPLLLALAGSAPVAAAPLLVIAHRGASGERPEHTLAAYERAIDAGADFIEPDLVATRDLHLIARHETELSDTTDIATRAEFADRKRTKDVEGRSVTGWFAEDFTLAEIRTLRAKERLPALRPANTRYDGLYQVPTFEEIAALARAKGAERGRAIGLYPELKHPTMLLEQAGIDMVDLLVAALRKAGLDQAKDRVFVQVFEVAPLQRLDKLVEVPLILLISSEGGPYDEKGLRWKDMMTPSGLAEIATYADGIGPFMGHVLGPDGAPTRLVADARAAGLKVHPWTLRKENFFMVPALKNPGAPGATGKLSEAVALLERAGVDGVFTDDPALVVAAARR
jgi:glycerophosphoryl diester phosphodiesterase